MFAVKNDEGYLKYLEIKPTPAGYNVRAYLGPKETAIPFESYYEAVGIGVVLDYEDVRTWVEEI